MMHWGNFGGMGYGGFGGIFMVLLWVVVILGFVYLVKRILSDKRGTFRTESAENILKKRYAAGEITKDEFKEMIKVIS